MPHHYSKLQSFGQQLWDLFDDKGIQSTWSHFWWKQLTLRELFFPRSWFCLWFMWRRLEGQSPATTTTNSKSATWHWDIPWIRHCRLLKLLFVVSATNAASERSAPAPGRLKTYRTTMPQERLNHCMVLHVRKKMTDKLKVPDIRNLIVSTSNER